MKRGGDRRRALLVRVIGLSDHIDVLGSFENGHGLNGEGESVTIGLGSGEVEMEKVVVPGMVGGEEDAEDSTRISGGSRDEISDGGRGGVRGEIGVGEEDLVSLAVREEKRIGSSLGGVGGGGGGGGKGEEEKE